MSCYRPLKATRRREGGLRFYRDLFSAATAKSKGADLLSIPCGKCIGCRLDHSKMWMIRIMHEASQHEVSSFITLTYNDQHLPHGDRPSLDKRDLQLFHKRARKVRAYRHFCSGEYGSKGGRPHYHVLAFGWRPEYTRPATATTWHSEEAEEAWSVNGSLLGDVTVGNLTTASAAYVSQYVLKKQRYRSEREEGRAPEYITMSHGIGASWLARYGKELDRGYVVFEGRKIRLPRYYLEKKGDIDPDWYLLQKLEKRAERREKPFDPDEPRRLHAAETILQSRRNLFGNGSSSTPDHLQK